MNHLIWIVLAALGIFLLATCNTNKQGGTTTAEDDSFAPQLHDIWVLTHLDGKALAKSIPAPQVELFPGDGRMSGFGGCNQLFGKLNAGATRISFTDIGSTKKMCREQMDLERQFMAKLQVADTYALKNLELILSNDKVEVLRFRKVD